MGLTVHTKLEEEIFYPAVKAALRDKELVPEANVEHATVKDLIAQVRDAEPGGEEYDAKRSRDDGHSDGYQNNHKKSQADQ